MSPVFTPPTPAAPRVATRRGVPLRVRLVLGLLMLAAILIAPLMVTRGSLTELFTDLQQLQSQNFGASLLLGRLRASAGEVRQSEKQIGALRDTMPAPQVKFRAAVRRLRQQSDSLRARTRGSAYAATVDSAVTDVEAIARRSLALMSARDFDMMDTLSLTELSPSLVRLVTALDSAEATLRAETRNKVNRAGVATERTLQVSRFALLVALVFAALVAGWIIVSISRPVADLQLGMERVAAGQFDHRLAISDGRTDEFGHLAESYAAMAQRLGELDRLKAEFVSMASHELKTPLNVILGYLTLLDDGVYGPLNDKQRDVVHTLERQSHSLNRLVRQLLDVSKFDAGGATLRLGAIDTRSFFDELDSSLRVLADQRGVVFSVSCADGMPSEVWWDHDRMTEALGNLVTNACKFTPRGGVVSLTGDGDPGRVRIEVRDSGVGIPAPELPHVFRKFFQAGNQAAASVGGTGLGLAIVRGIVEAHGGTVGVSSEVAVGTTFTISLPQRAPTSRRHPHAPQQPATAAALPLVD